jgi:hypothetical protein
MHVEHAIGVGVTHVEDAEVCKLEGEILRMLHLHQLGYGEVGSRGVSSHALELLGYVLLYACAYLVFALSISHGRII